MHNKPENDINRRELDKAYAEDMERKAAREEDLQAARDYLGVLLAETEGKSQELESKKQEALELTERLSRTESEIASLQEETERSKKNGKLSTLWMCFSSVELVVIVVLLIILIVGLRKSNSADSIGQMPDNSVTGTVNNEENNIPSQAPETLKYCDDLESRIKTISREAVSPFTVSAEEIDGLECLVFTHDEAKIAYRNEYYPSEMGFRKCVIFETGNQRFTFSKNYSFEEDLSSLSPKLTRINNRDMLVLMDYDGGFSSTIPKVFRLIDCSSFRIYSAEDIKERVLGLMDVKLLEEQSVLEDSPMVYRLTTSKASYNYCVSEGYATGLEYNGIEFPEIDTGFRLLIDENGITFKTEVMLGEEYYLGQLSGNFVLRGEDIVISNAKFGAYVPYNQEDPELAGFIRPVSQRPERYLTVSGLNSERYYIAFNNEIGVNDYYWENLNTEDKNNWVYYDADGNEASIRGIDVSKYQGEIDWKQVAEAGVQFAVIRMGYRGMNEGTLSVDPYFVRNVTEADKYGIKVGIYFFSQAVTVEEACEEAEFVLDNIREYNITYPVAFDTERVAGSNARANSLSVKDRTDICIAFCKTVADEGYVPMIYANTKYMLMGLELERLKEYELWYALYSDTITYPYRFEMFQYSDKGTVPGISGNVDLDISFKDYSVTE